jgi:hypothetical protein
VIELPLFNNTISTDLPGWGRRERVKDGGTLAEIRWQKSEGSVKMHWPLGGATCLFNGIERRSVTGTGDT